MILKIINVTCQIILLSQNDDNPCLTLIDRESGVNIYNFKKFLDLIKF